MWINKIQPPKFTESTFIQPFCFQSLFQLLQQLFTVGGAAASSMICGKELLVFDEPTSGLDYDSMVRLSALIRRLSDIGKVIFIVTHDYEFVCRTCTRVLHLDGGEIRDDFSITEALLQTVKKIFDVR